MNTQDWKDSVKQLIEMAPVVVIDGRAVTDAVRYEAQHLFSTGQAKKAIFIGHGRNRCPIITELLEKQQLERRVPVAVASENECFEEVEKMLRESVRGKLLRENRFA